MGATDPTPESVEKKDVEVKAEESSSKPVEDVEDVPDPDEDDLDDLDDMLDDFSAVKLDQSKTEKTEAPAATSAPAAATATSEAPQAAAPLPGEPGSNVSEEEFAKQLQAGMADLLGELEKSPQMQQEFEDMFKQFTAATDGADAESASGAGAAAGASKAAADAGADATFQDTIRRTMERMQNSGEQATAAAASGGADDFMSELLKQMSGGGDLGGEGGEEEFSKMLMGMMEQLTNKDILYEPMKELNDKFPEWMEKNKETTSAEDLKRYDEQQVLVKEIVDKFESPTYTDSNAADREYIVERMQKMQEAGSPPSDLVGDMASAQEAFGGGGGDGADEQCNPQ